MTQSEFIKRYCENSGFTEEHLNSLGLFAMPCDCGERDCQGWQMQTRDTLFWNIKTNKEINNA